MGKGRMPNKSLQARIKYIRQAAEYLTLQSNTSLTAETKAADATESQAAIDDKAQDTIESDNMLDQERHPHGSSAARLVSHLTSIAQKSQIRLAPDVKHQICKRCSTLLIEGSTSRKFVENLSRGGRKPHADVLIAECRRCGARKRWPIGMPRQAKGKKARGGVVGSQSAPD